MPLHHQKFLSWWNDPVKKNLNRLTIVGVPLLILVIVISIVLVFTINPKKEDSKKTKETKTDTKKEETRSFSNGTRRGSSTEIQIESNENILGSTIVDKNKDYFSPLEDLTLSSMEPEQRNYIVEAIGDEDSDVIGGYKLYQESKGKVITNGVEFKKGSMIQFKWGCPPVDSPCSIDQQVSLKLVFSTKNQK